MSLPSHPPSSAVPKSLSDNDVANLEKIAALRGYAGHLRAAIQEANGCVDAPWLFGHEAISACLRAARILSRALETPVPEDGTPKR